MKADELSVFNLALIVCIVFWGLVAAKGCSSRGVYRDGKEICPVAARVFNNQTGG